MTSSGRRTAVGLEGTLSNTREARGIVFDLFGDTLPELELYARVGIREFWILDLTSIRLPAYVFITAV